MIGWQCKKFCTNSVSKLTYYYYYIIDMDKQLSEYTIDFTWSE
jgi:hypothetical protein